jgi:2-polyprenyl-3-methyl-5-hydroxy-6-metoxy-1,4-benzoquinol methylase
MVREAAAKFIPWRRESDEADMGGMPCYDERLGPIMLSQREVVPELMDAADLDAAVHAEALEGLRRLNQASRAAAIIARPIKALARRQALATLSVLDVACGGGDVPVEVARRLRVAGVQVELTLSDRSTTALGQAQKLATKADVRARGARGEAPHGLPEGTFDVVTNSLFLHHLERQEVVATLAAMAKRARWMVVVSDLRRSAMGLAVAWIACRVFGGNAIVRHDGTASVRAAWTMEELSAMAREAGLDGARLRRCWPWRMLLVWEKP